jgi:phosphoribosylamine--glycine ligase
MGSHSPVPDLTAADIRQVVDRVIAPVTAEMAQRGTPFSGVLYAGLMLTDRGPQALEFNVRFGDPETQSIIPRLESDLAEVVWAVASGKLRTIKPKWREECAVCVVASSGGYPGDYSTGHEIAGVEEANAVEGVMVFHAGTKRTPDGRLVTSGGRVLGTTGLGRDLKEAASKAYSAMSRIRFSGMHYRRDVFGSPEGE